MYEYRLTVSNASSAVLRQICQYFLDSDWCSFLNKLVRSHAVCNAENRTVTRDGE